MHDALERAVGIIPDRVGRFLGPGVEFRGRGHELARNGVARIGGIDELGNVGGQRQRIARGDRLDLATALVGNQSGRDELIGAAQRLAGWSHDDVLA